MDASPETDVNNRALLKYFQYYTRDNDYGPTWSVRKRSSIVQYPGVPSIRSLHVIDNVPIRLCTYENNPHASLNSAEVEIIITFFD